MTLSAILMLPAVSAINGWPHQPTLCQVDSSPKQVPNNDGKWKNPRSKLPTEMISEALLSLSHSRFLGSMIENKVQEKIHNFPQLLRRTPGAGPSPPSPPLQVLLDRSPRTTPLLIEPMAPAETAGMMRPNGRCSLQGYFNNMGGICLGYLKGIFFQ